MSQRKKKSLIFSLRIPLCSAKRMLRQKAIITITNLNRLSPLKTSNLFIQSNNSPQCLFTKKCLIEKKSLKLFTVHCAMPGKKDAMAKSHYYRHYSRCHCRILHRLWHLPLKAWLIRHHFKAKELQNSQGQPSSEPWCTLGHKTLKNSHFNIFVFYLF